MNKKITSLTLAVVLGCSIMLTACGAQKKADTSTVSSVSPGSEQASEVSAPANDQKFAVVFDIAGIGDNGFNGEIYAGAQQASKEYGIPFDYVEPKSMNDYETQLRMYADSEEYDLIIAVGANQVDALKMVAPDYPDQKFTILDVPVEGFDNIHAVSAKNPEQTFLSGVLAGLTTIDERMPLANPENIIGFAIAMDSPVSRSQAAGFMAGAKYANPEVEIITNFIGSYKDPGKAKEIAMSAYGRGADVVSHNAGGSGMGVFAAAKEANRYVIGSSLASVDPDHSLCTSRKKMELFVMQEIESIKNNTWKAGITLKGLAEGICDYDIENLNTVIPEDMIEKVYAAKQAIIDGKLTLPDDISQIDEWSKNNKMKS